MRAKALVSYAEVAELADALGSGPSGSNIPWRFEFSLRHFKPFEGIKRFFCFKIKKIFLILLKRIIFFVILIYNILESEKKNNATAASNSLTN